MTAGTPLVDSNVLRARRLHPEKLTPRCLQGHPGRSKSGIDVKSVQGVLMSQKKFASLCTNNHFRKRAGTSYASSRSTNLHFMHLLATHLCHFPKFNVDPRNHGMPIESTMDAGARYEAIVPSKRNIEALYL
jgi:hypothetical protein